MENDIKLIQETFNVEITGKLDFLTMSAIKNFQWKNNLPPTGLLDELTKSVFFEKNPSIISTKPTIYNDKSVEFTTDLMEVHMNPIVKEYMLDKDEFLTYTGTNTTIPYIFIHHTSGWNNPIATVKDWNNDTRGRIGTRYVIGGINLSSNDSQYDGMIIKCMPDNGWAYHLGGTNQGVNQEMHKYSIGIELCNFGYLIRKNGKFLTYTGAVVDSKYVVELNTPFNGYTHWHKYSEKQMESLKYLLGALCVKYNINKKNGLVNRINTLGINNAFSYSKECAAGKVGGILSHTNVRADKTDVCPQPLLVDMLINL